MPLFLLSLSYLLDAVMNAIVLIRVQDDERVAILARLDEVRKHRPQPQTLVDHERPCPHARPHCATPLDDHEQLAIVAVKVAAQVHVRMRLVVLGVDRDAHFGAVVVGDEEALDVLEDEIANVLVAGLIAGVIRAKVIEFEAMAGGGVDENAIGIEGVVVLTEEALGGGGGGVL